MIYFWLSSLRSTSRIYHKDKAQIIKYENTIENMERQVANLKIKNENLSKRIYDLENEINNLVSPTKNHE